MRNKKIKFLLLMTLLVIAILCFVGCTRAEVSFERDGAGECTVTVDKADGITKEYLEGKIDEVIQGVTMQSQMQKLELKSITENEDSFTVFLKFRQIADIKGLGNFSYETGESFGSQLVQRNMFSQLAAGKISSKNLVNYNSSAFTILSEDVYVHPKAVSEEKIEADDFKAADNKFYTKENVVFQFTICGLPEVSSITFKFPGKILVYSDLNTVYSESNSLTVTPQKVMAREIGVGDNGAFSKEGEYDLFVGYVIFELNADYTVWIVIGSIALVVGGLIAAGFLTGVFKKFFKSKVWATIVKNRVLYLFLLPGFVLFAVFNYAPMVGIIVAFKNYTVDGGIFGSEWANSFGFEHFITLFTHPGSEFGMIFRNTIVMAILKLITGFPAAIILALMFNSLNNGVFKKSVQTISYLPYFVSWVVVSNIVYLFLSANGGIVNEMIELFGGEKIRFYSEPKYWWGIITITSLWKTVGWGTIVYLAAITAINPDLYEAAAIDGAGSWRMLWTVTIPGMMPVIGIQLILNVGNLIKDDFDQIYSLVGGSNYELRSVTEVFSSLVFRNLQAGPKGFSASTAISLVQSVISLVLVLCADKIVRKTDNPGLW